MKPSRFAVAAVFTISVLLSESRACEVPQPGHNLDTDDLIREANTIVLVRLRSTSTHPEQKSWTEYTLETVKVIKGKAEPSYRFIFFGSNESDNDFAGHTAPEFWYRAVDQRPLGRSEWPCCICGPDHSFRKDRQYLYFPDKLGAMKSAEGCDC